MRVDEPRPGWRTDFTLHGVAALVGQRDDCHVALGVNTPYAGQRLPAWQAAGFELHVNAVMRLLPGGLREPPATKRAAVTVRPIVWQGPQAEPVRVVGRVGG